MLDIEISPDVTALVERLRAVAPGSSVTYAELSSAIGRDVRQHRSLLASAQRIAAREHAAVFANERHVGYRRLTTDQLPDVGATARARIRSASRRASRRMKQGVVGANHISPIAQRKINAELSALALIEHVASDRQSAPAEAHQHHPEPVAIMARRLFATPA